MARERRRAVRKSDAENYDRSFDRPDAGSPDVESVVLGDAASGKHSDSVAGDGLRTVSFDGVDEEETGSFSEAFYREQQPPHHG